MAREDGELGFITSMLAGLQVMSAQQRKRVLGYIIERAQEMQAPVQPGGDLVRHLADQLAAEDDGARRIAQRCAPAPAGVMDVPPEAEEPRSGRYREARR